MANLTFEVSLNDTWKDVTTDHSLVSGARYLVDIGAIAAGAKIQSARTDSASTAPAGIVGHPWEPVAWAESLNQKEFKQKTGVFLWAKVSSGAATLVFTKL